MLGGDAISQPQKSTLSCNKGDGRCCLSVVLQQRVFWSCSFTLLPLPLPRYLGGPVRGDLGAAVAGQWRARSRLPGQIPGRGSGHQESERSERNGYQAPAETQAS